ncbi:T9SS type A sorting domain-containing protein [Epilithonimonas lactis]|uniref:Por secretion system C-terminal sorting domain-containing protein n=1 Tax=Epilithonimonas lactis TaxID=421072 RepID=A0A085BFJ2_9FLAO|nr:T9SS type A sorting domain-containing protein [Epilithonimonas lactis]KFC21237.1 hypothetical protein IO89_13625 [Epilithonimonas lactis]SEP78136.1 Por secretion system C-terminal sorting domain-containing protein [Epilithonimonas lactis]
MRKFFFWLFLCGVTMLFGQRYIVDSDGIGKYGYLDKNATTYMRLNSGNESNIYELFGRTWTGSSSVLTYGTAVNICGGTQNVNQSTGDYTFASGMLPGSIAYTSVHANYCGNGNSYGGNPHNTGLNEKQHYIFELTTRGSDLSSNIVVGNKNVVMSAKIDFGSLSDRKLQRFWIKNNGTFAESTEIANDGFKIYYEPATGSETFDGTENNATIYGEYGGNSITNNEYGHDALNIDIPAGGLRVYVVLETLVACSPGKTINVNLLNDGLSFSPIPPSNSKSIARVNALPITPISISYNYPSTSITPISQTVDLYAAVTNLSVSVAGTISYQWYRNTVANNYGGTSIAGATSYTYEPPTGPSAVFNNPGTNYYYCIATTGVGACDKVVSSVSAVTVNNSNVANWANIQSPKVHQNMYEGIGVDIFAQVYINGSTPGDGRAPNVNAWIGYSINNSNPNIDADWTWKVANYNEAQAFRKEYNDEYWIKDFGKDLPAGTYYVASRFQKESGAYVYGAIDGTTSNESGGIWDGSNYYNLKLMNDQTVTWTGTAWNNISGPNITSPAIISGDSTPPPSFSAKTLTINSGVGLTIGDEQSVTLENELINNNGTSSSKTLIVESGGNFIQNNPSTSNVGNIKVKREAVVPKTQYNFWSSPVSGQNLYGLYQSGNAVVANRVYTYNTLTDYYTAVPSGNFASGIGYSIQGESFSNSSAAFFGLPNNGDISVELRTTGNRYNLIGNPYPSNISAEVFYTSNLSQIENTLWFWDNTGNTAAVQMGSGYSAYGTNNFATYNLPSGVGNPGTGTQNNASKIPNGKIVVGQGFIVKAKNISSPTAIFKNNMRTSNSGVFFAKQSAAKDVFWLQLATPTNLINTTAVVYNDNAQNNLDEFDSDFPSLSSDALYTLADNDYKKLSIQGRNNTGLENDRLKVGAQFYRDGTYTFIMKERQGIFESGQKIYLKDKKTNIYTDLTSQSYSFEATKGIDENRFEIVYKNLQVLGVDNNRKSEFVLYKDGDSFVVKSSQVLGKVEVYDVAGRLVRESSSREKELRMVVSDLPNAVYIIKAENSGDPKMKKIFK